MMAERDDNPVQAVDEALTQFVNAYVQGKHPDIDAFIEQYPQHERLIRQRVKGVFVIDALFDSIVKADESEFEGAVGEGELVGKSLANFEVKKVIGRGGMGVVYLARDTKLDRTVAIKGMPVKLAQNSSAQMRFKREAKLLASLNHPNIAVIHEIMEQDEDTSYLILEYIPGETLAQRIARVPLTLEQALPLALEIAEAVSAAHEKGVVHRDLKPGNIKITPEGRIKILDFGLAKASDNPGQDSQITVTEPGHIVGTPAYMSPEQARGQATDTRTDIWSFGCILYEMLSGQLPFAGETATDTLVQIIEREPDWNLLPKETPAKVRTLLRRCLEKDLDKRLDNIADVTIQIDDALSRPLTAPEPTMSPRLKRTAMLVCSVLFVSLLALGAWHILSRQTPPPQPRTTLVVLPFKNTGPGEGWFAEGLTDEIRTRLGCIHGLTVIEKPSVIAFKNMGMPAQAAQEHSLDYFLKGTVQCERPSDPNSQVRIRVQLIKAADNTQVWQEPFDRKMGDIFQLQSDVAEKVALELDIRLLQPERKALAYGYIDNTEAYACFVRSNQNLGKGKEGNDQAIELLGKAIKLEPNYAEAHARLSNALINMYWMHGRNREYLPRARQAVDKAIELDPDLPGAHTTLGRYYYQGHYDYENALEQFEIARKSRPNSAGVLHWVGVTQHRQGRVEEALATLKRASEWNPISPRSLRVVAVTLKFLRRYAEAETYLDQIIRLVPDSPWAYVEKAWMCILQGKTKKARADLEEALLKVNQDASAGIYYLLITLDIYDREYAAALEKQLLKSPDLDILAMFIPNELRRAEIHGSLGEKESAKRWYKKAVDILEKKVAENPDISRYHSTLGMAYAGLGQKQDAVREGELAVKHLPVEKDAVDGPQRIEDLARIYVMVGKYDEAIEKLDYLFSIPAEVSKHYLKLDPIWKPLHNHALWEQLVGNE
jgi:serine/threonine protein kinase/tetratricopeptide (TPR) repeat protein